MSDLAPAYDRLIRTNVRLRQVKFLMSFGRNAEGDGLDIWFFDFFSRLRFLSSWPLDFHNE